MKVHYGKNSKLLFTDTDSLMNEVVTEDLYADMVDNAELCDNSNLDISNKF